jgi:voltage-gated potassium channel
MRIAAGGRSAHRYRCRESSSATAFRGLLGSPVGRRPGMAGLEPSNPNPNRMADESALERRLARAVARATTPRGAIAVIATVSTMMTVGAGLLMTVVDGKNFPSVGSGLWWGVQTVTTVGYGDDVPTNLTGRLVAVLVMLLGIAFLTVITASITSTFVTRSRHEPSDTETAIAEQFRQLDSRLERIEAALSRSSSP